MRSTRGNIITIPLNRGMDQSQDENLAETGVLFDVRNMRVYGDGLLEKRIGSTGFVPSSLNSSIPYRVATNSAEHVSVNGEDRIRKPAFLSTVGGRPIVGESDGTIFSIDKEFAGPIGQFSRCVPKRERSTLRIYRYPSNPTMTAPSVAVNSDGYVMVVTADDLGNGTSGISGYVESPSGVRTATIAIPVGPVVKVQVVVFSRTEFHVFFETDLLRIRRIVCTIDQGGGLVRSSPTQIGNLLSGSSTFWDCTSDGVNTTIVFHHSSNFIEIQSNTANGTATGSVTTGPQTNGNVPCSVYMGSNGRIWVGLTNNTAAGLRIVQYRVYSLDDDVPLLDAESGLITIEGYAATTDFAGPPLIGPWKNDRNAALAVWSYRDGDADSDFAGTKICKLNFISGDSPSRIIWHVIPIAKPDAQMRVWSITSENVGGGNPHDGTFGPSALARVALISYWQPAFVTDELGFSGVELSAPQMPNPDGYRLTTPVLSWGFNFFNEVAYTREQGGRPSDGTSYVFAFPFVLAKYLQDQFRMEVRVYEYETAENEPHRETTIVGPSTIVVGGVPIQLPGFSQPQRHASITALGHTYEGAAGACEVGFLTRPHIENITESPGTGLTIDAAYSYRAIYEWIDDLGQRHRSAPSEPRGITPTTSGQMPLLYVDLLSASKRQVFPTGYSDSLQNPQISVYRTVGGGTEYRRLPTTYLSMPTLSSPSSLGPGYAAFVDQFADYQIEDQEILYTDGGVKNNDLAPTSTWSTRSEDRVWLGGGWRKDIVQCSKILFPQEPVQFSDHDSFKVVLPFENTGLAYQDGHVFAFGSNDIAVITGEGPNDQGAGTFNVRVFAHGIGCKNHKSILETKGGIFFQGPDGWYRIPRGPGEPEYIGAVRDEHEDRSAVVLSSAVVPGRAGGFEARFLTAPSGSKATSQLLTTDGKNWYRDEYAGITMMELGAWPKGTVLCDENMRLLYEDDPSVFTDNAGGNSAAIRQRFKTSRIWPFGPGGWGHVKRALLGFVCQQQSFLTFQVQTDSNAAQSITDLVSPTGAVQYREIIINDPKCSNIQVEATDLPLADASAQGFKFVSLSIEAENSGGLRLTSQDERG